MKIIRAQFLFISSLYFWLGFLLQDVISLDILWRIPIVAVSLILGMVLSRDYLPQNEREARNFVESSSLFIFLFFATFTFAITKSIFAAMLFGWIACSAMILLVLQAMAIAELKNQFSQSKQFLIFSVLAVVNMISGIFFNRFLVEQFSFSFKDLL